MDNFRTTIYEVRKYLEEYDTIDEAIADLNKMPLITREMFTIFISHDSSNREYIVNYAAQDMLDEVSVTKWTELNRHGHVRLRLAGDGLTFLVDYTLIKDIAREKGAIQPQHHSFDEKIKKFLLKNKLENFIQD